MSMIGKLIRLFIKLQKIGWSHVTLFIIFPVRKFTGNIISGPVSRVKCTIINDKLLIYSSGDF